MASCYVVGLIFITRCRGRIAMGSKDRMVNHGDLPIYIRRYVAQVVCFAEIRINLKQRYRTEHLKDSSCGLTPV